MVFTNYKNVHTNIISKVVLDNKIFTVGENTTEYSLQITIDYELFGKNIYINICDYITGSYILCFNLFFIKPFTTETITLLNLNEYGIYQINIIDTKNYGLQSNNGIQIQYYYQTQVLQNYDINGNFGNINELIIFKHNDNSVIEPVVMPLCPGYFNLDLLSFKILQRCGWDEATIELKYKSNIKGPIKWELLDYIITDNPLHFNSGYLEVQDIYQDLLVIKLTIYNLNLWKYLKITFNNSVTRCYEILNFYTFEFLDVNTRLYFYPNGHIDFYILIDSLYSYNSNNIQFTIDNSHYFYLEPNEIINNRIKYKFAIPYKNDFTISSTINFSYYFVYQQNYYYQHCSSNTEYQIFNQSQLIPTNYKEYEYYRELSYSLYTDFNFNSYHINTILYDGSNLQLEFIRKSNRPIKIIVNKMETTPFQQLTDYLFENKDLFYFSTNLSKKFNKPIKILLSHYLNNLNYQNIFDSFLSSQLEQFQIKGFYDLENYNLNFWYSKKDCFSPLHHDGNKYNFNLCLFGKKKWYLRPPNTDLDNLELQEKNSNFIEIDTCHNEILYLPEFWLHKVKTLQETVCYSYWYDDNLIHNDIRFLV